MLCVLFLVVWSTTEWWMMLVFCFSKLGCKKRESLSGMYVPAGGSRQELYGPKWKSKLEDLKFLSWKKAFTVHTYLCSISGITCWLGFFFFLSNICYCSKLCWCISSTRALVYSYCSLWIIFLSPSPHSSFITSGLNVVLKPPPHKQE